jgi:hypothetical protein
VLKSSALQYSDSNFPHKEAWDENYLHVHS